jgi:hypothetical protein
VNQRSLLKKPLNARLYSASVNRKLNCYNADRQEYEKHHNTDNNNNNNNNNNDNTENNDYQQQFSKVCKRRVLFLAFLWCAKSLTDARCLITEIFQFSHGNANHTIANWCQRYV